MSNNVSNASVKSNPSEITDNSSQKAADTEMTSVATPSESNDVALDVDAIDIDALLDIADADDVTWVREQHQLAEVINALATESGSGP